jgi:probable DNA repair protein
LLAAHAAGHTILAPNIELAAALFDALERAQTEAGRRVWTTPRVLDFGSWLRELHGRRQLVDPDSRRVLSDPEERELWRAAVRDTAVARDFLDPGGAALAARRARRALADYEIPLAALSLDASEEVQAFLSWNRSFERRCRELHCISTDGLLGLGRPIGTIAWIESPLWRPAARQWLSRHGCVLEPQAGTAQSSMQVSAPSPASEMSAIAEWARAKLQGDENFRAWICIPDLNRRRAQVVDALDAAMAPQRFALREDFTAAPYAVAGGTPLSDYAPVRAALESLAAGLGPLPYPKFSALLRSPELQESGAEAGTAALLDVALRERATSEADLATWLDLAERVARRRRLSPVAALRRLVQMREARAHMRGAQHISAWVSVWIAALHAGPWSLRHRWSSIEYQAAQRFRELLAALATGDAVFGTRSQDSALRVLQRSARDTAFQPQTGVPPVWITGQLMDPWLNYDALWVGGCSDDQWPPPIAPLPLVPIRLQREYGVISASAAAQLAMALDLQHRWQSRAGHCFFSHSDAGDGNSSAPSPVLPRTLAVMDVPPGAVTRLHWRLLAAAAPTLESIWDESAPPFSPEERTRGVSTLRSQSRCAFKGFAETRLLAQPLEQPVPGFNSRERGQLVHHALEHVWSVLADSKALLDLPPEAEQRLLDEAVRKALAIVRKIRDPGPRWRRRERMRLQNVIKTWLDIERRRAPFTVEVLEQSVRAARIAGLEFRARIDRVDRLADGARVLIDYKTGAATADWRGERPDNPQLPMYALLLPEALVAVAYARVKAGDFGFVAEAARGDVFKPRARASALEGQASFQDLVNVWSRRIERIAGEFAAGRAEVAPTVKACKTCGLQGLCRIPAALEAAESR